MPNPLLFTPLTIRGTTLKNRIVVAPMHQYSAVAGHATDWHLMNIGRFAAGGAGLVFIESTKVERRGCGTVGDLGIWHDDFIPQFRRMADFMRAQGCVPALQIGHSGRKARMFRPWKAASRSRRKPPRPRASPTGPTGSWSPPAPCPAARANRSRAP